jgi:hypothetical protein
MITGERLLGQKVLARIVQLTASRQPGRDKMRASRAKMQSRR